MAALRRTAAAAVLLTALCGCSASPVPPTGTVSGHVVAGPTCPVERLASPCAPRPVSGAEVVASDQGRTIARTHTDSSGEFSMTLPLGTHTLTAYNVGGYRSSAAATVTVGPSPAALTLTVDSGIR